MAVKSAYIDTSVLGAYYCPGTAESRSRVRLAGC